MPEEKVTPRCQPFLLMLVVTLALMGAVLTLDRPLSQAGFGIFALEFAGDLDTAKGIIKAWGESGRIIAIVQTSLDYLFLVAYSITFFLGCRLAGHWWSRCGEVLAKAGLILGYGALLAGLLDAIENYALVSGLMGSQEAWWPAVAYWCALVKFILLAVAGAYFLIGLVVRFVCSK